MAYDPKLGIDRTARSSLYLRNSEALLITKLAAGYELIGRNLVKVPFIDREEQCVIDYACDQGHIEIVCEKPLRYAITQRGLSAVFGSAATHP